MLYLDGSRYEHELGLKPYESYRLHDISGGPPRDIPITRYAVSHGNKVSAETTEGELLFSSGTPHDIATWKGDVLHRFHTGQFEFAEGASGITVKPTDPEGIARAIATQAARVPNLHGRPGTAVDSIRTPRTGIYHSGSFPHRDPAGGSGPKNLR